MTRFSRGAAHPSDRPRPAPWPVPPELPAGLAHYPGVLQLISADSVARGCGSARHVQRCIDVTQATARALDPQARIRCAASARTAAHHLGLLTSSGNNQWSVSRRAGNAGQVLLEEMNDLISARLIATRPRPERQRRARPADLVILVATIPSTRRQSGGCGCWGSRPVRRCQAVRSPPSSTHVPNNGIRTQNTYRRASVTGLPNRAQCPPFREDRTWD
jgi:hypothetical protein